MIKIANTVKLTAAVIALSVGMICGAAGSDHEGDETPRIKLANLKTSLEQKNKQLQYENSNAEQRYLPKVLEVWSLEKKHAFLRSHHRLYQLNVAIAGLKNDIAAIEATQKLIKADSYDNQLG